MKNKISKARGKELITDLQARLVAYKCSVKSLKRMERLVERSRKDILKKIKSFPSDFRPLYEDQLNRIKNKI